MQVRHTDSLFTPAHCSEAGTFRQSPNGIRGNPSFHQFSCGACKLQRTGGFCWSFAWMFTSNWRVTSFVGSKDNDFS